ncbi:MAG: hypothetical protein FWG29_05640 [Treponema sp.]|nr:hypothetical protein [Treponema sp.]
MAGKRINPEAPLTGAEKQKRYRQKIKDGEAAEEEAGLAKLEALCREVLVEYIDGLDRGEFFTVYDRLSNPENYVKRFVSLEELSELSGIDVKDLKKLEKQGVISPVDPSNYAA